MILNPQRVGLAVIINNIAKEFPGSLQDTEALTRTYRLMKFEVHLYEDLDESVSHVMIFTHQHMIQY